METSTRFLSFLLYIYMIVLPIAPSKFKVGNIPFNGDILLALLIVCYLIIIVIFKNVRNRFLYGLKDFFTNYLTIFISLLVFIMLISVSYSTDKKLALSESIRFCTYGALFFIIKYELNNKYISNNILKLYIYVVSLISSIGILEYILGIGFIQKSEHGIRTRIFSTLENSNNLGAFMVMGFFPIVMLMLNEKEKRKKLYLGIASLLTFTNIILSFSRNAWLALVVGIIILSLTYSWKIILGMGGLGVISLLIPQINNRLLEFTDKSQNLSRIKLWDIAFMMIKDHPFTGVGNGNYRVMYDIYKLKYKKKIEYYPTDNFHTHNVFLKIQSELGLFGTVAFLGIIISIVVNVVRFIKKIDIKFYKIFYTGFFASVIAFVFMNIIDNFFSAPKVIAFFWILVANFEGILYKNQES
ncbi:MAG: O-antigen ligase family protein [Clostridium lundense]|nr:O-antigen ligase family protein [Clostridium lundense]